MSDMLKSYRFREERESDWRKLDLILTRAENSGVKGLSDEDMTALPRLYRQAVSSLSVARWQSKELGWMGSIVLFPFRHWVARSSFSSICFFHPAHQV